MVPGAAVCLTSSMKKAEKGNYEKMLALNVSKKEKSEYVIIWKRLMEEFKNKKCKMH